MKIIREYKKDSKHKWWRITLKASFNSNIIGYKTSIQELKFTAYGFSSKHNYSNNGIHNDYDEFSFIGVSRKDVISKERELINMYYEHILLEIEKNKEWLSKQKKEFNRQEKLLNSFFDVHEFKVIERKLKLDKLNEIKS